MGFTEFLSWYLAPWRRIGRRDFGIALLVATLPGLLLMFVGFGSSASHFMGPLMGLADVAQSGNPDELLKQAQALQAGMGTGAPETGFAVDWTGVLNNVLLLALLPLTRMRLRDMGWLGRKELIVAVVLNLSVANSLLVSLTGLSVLPLAWLFGVVNFVGYIWLSVAQGKAYVPPSGRTDYMVGPDDLKKRNDDDDTY
jgi:uncharacterized membrane protein YhaH (DUF805 family)